MTMHIIQVRTEQYSRCLHITKTCLCNKQRCLSFKNWKIFSWKIWIFFLFLLQNIVCGYSLEPPHPCIPQFCYIKVGFKGVYIPRICFPDDILIVETWNNENCGIRKQQLLIWPDWPWSIEADTGNIPFFFCLKEIPILSMSWHNRRKVQVGKAKSERNSHSKNRGGKN